MQQAGMLEPPNELCPPVSLLEEDVVSEGGEFGRQRK